MAMSKRKIRSLEELCAEFDANKPQGYIRTGLIPVDLLTGGNGLPGGTLLQFYSESGFGKSTTCLAICKALADQGKKSLYIAVEPNAKLAADMGLFDDRYKDLFRMVSLKTYSQLGNFTWSFLESDYTFMVIDSISACCVSQLAEGESDVEDSLPAIDARTRSVYLKVLNGNIAAHPDKCTIYLNQTRANFNGGWGAEPTTAEGGNAGKFYAALQFTMKGDARVLDEETTGSKEIVGKSGYLWATKNRFSKPFARIPIEVIFGKGVSNIYSCLNYLYWKGCISQAGAQFKINFNGVEESVKGKSGRRNWVREHLSEISADLYENIIPYYKALCEGYKVDI